MSNFETIKIHFHPQLSSKKKNVEEVIKKSEINKSQTVSDAQTNLNPSLREKIVVIVFIFLILITTISFLLVAITKFFSPDKSEFFIDVFWYGLSIIIGYFLGYSKEK